MWRAHYLAFLVTLSSLWACFSPAATQTIHHVCPTAACTFTKISDAVLVSGPGDIVRVLGGAYQENTTIPSASISIETTSPIHITMTDTSLALWLVINANITVRLNGTFQVAGSLQVDGGTLETYGTLNVTNGLDPLVKVTDPGQWLHHGHVELASTLLSAVTLEGGTWDQLGSANITTRSGQCVSLISSAAWNQSGSTQLEVTHSGTAVEISPGIWTQSGTLHVIASNHASGVRMSGQSLYFQRNTSSFVLDAGTLGISLDGQWTQRAATHMTVQADCTGVEVRTEAGSWRQQNKMTLDITGSSATGVFFATPVAKWEQISPVEISVSGGDSSGVRFDGSGQRWEQSGDVTITVQGAESCGVNLGTAGPSVWQQLGSKPTVSATGLHSAALCPAPLPSVSVEAVKAHINDTTPSVVVVPRDPSPDAAGQAQVDFLSLREVTPAGDLVWAARLQDGWVRTGSGSNNVSSTTTFTSRLANNATLTYEFATFDADTALTLATNYTFSITPAFLKFTLRLDSWNWSSSDNQLEFQMVIDPPFATSELRLNTPQADTTTIFLPSAANSEAGTLVRLLAFGLTNASSQRVACSSSADAASSSITISFDHFDTNLDYDPDISLLLGGRRDDGDGSGSGGTEWVIAVAVAVPVAVAAVVLVIAVVLVVAFVRSRRRSSAALAVNFDDDNNGEEL